MDAYFETTIESFDKTRIWYRRMGSGAPTLMLCDGVGCDGYVWKYLIPYFEGRYRLIHWNYRGHGHSGPPADPDRLGIEECAEDLVAVMDHAGVAEPAVLLGHSMGVQVILEFVHRWPERVRALVPLTGSYGKAVDHVHDADWLRKLFPLIREAGVRFGRQLQPVLRELFRSEFAFWYARKFEINESLIKREDFFPYLEHLSRMDPVTFLKSLEGAARHTAEAYLPEIRVPTLIVAGTHDRFTPYWISQRMHALIPGSELLSLPLGSHTAPIEQPELVNLRLDRFLRELEDKK